MKKTLLFAIALSIPFFAHCQKSTYQGLFIYQFSKYIKWPEAYGDDTFVIEVFGDDDILKSISEMASVKKETQGMEIVVRKVKTVGEISKPHIVFIQNGYSNILGSLLSKIKSEPILIVTENPGSIEKGSIINFVEKEGKMRFELSQSRAESIGLKISGSIVSLAILK